MKDYKKDTLLHLSNEDLVLCLNKVYEALKENGILYASFKLGEEVRIEKNRYFNDMTEEKFKDICSKVNGFEILKV